MSNTKKQTLSFATLFLVFAAFSHSAMATPLVGPDVFTPIKPGSERSLDSIFQEIMTSDGITLQRVSDVNDSFWSLLGNGTTSTVVARARYAGYNNMFGVLDGTDGGLDGFQALLGSLSGNGVVGSGPGKDILLNLVGDFRLAIRTPTGQIWSSLLSDNADGKDHMVTWVDVNDPYHYYVAFEDLGFPRSDLDYNDFVLELRNVIDGPDSVPEPGSLALIVLGLAGLGYARRRKGLVQP